MQDEATWAPMKPFVCELSARKIAQVWFNHANDLGKSFGDKTREWEMDTVVKLSKIEEDETAIRLDFLKARLALGDFAGTPLGQAGGEFWMRIRFRLGSSRDDTAAKCSLLKRGVFAERKKQIWRL
jgi:hypothetical protein